MESNIDKIISKIGNLTTQKKAEIREFLILSGEVRFVVGAKLTNEFLGISKSLNRYTRLYWGIRGWSEPEIDFKIKQFKKGKPKRLSPFSVEFWIKKGHSKIEAEKIRNSKSPIYSEYWIEKGYDSASAKEKAIEVKSSNNIKASKNSLSRSDERIRSSSRRCVEYWLLRGYDLEESKIEVGKIQSTFSKAKCIEKYGPINGLQKWQDRQDGWQNTLKSKSVDEIILLNKNKNSRNLDNIQVKCDGDVVRIRNYIDDLYNNSILYDVELFINKIYDDIAENPHTAYKSPEMMVKLYSKMQFDILEIRSPVEFMNQFSKYGEIHKIDSHGHYRKWVDKGLLRSGHEILFYELLIKNNIKFELDNRYPDSNFRYDFYLVEYDIYVEIAPMYLTSESYALKMDKKKKLFGCVILKKSKEYESFVKSLLT